MDVEYLRNTGTRYEWACRYGGFNFVVIYHYLDDLWSVQKARDDGERELIGADRAADFMKRFPAAEALEKAGFKRGEDATLPIGDE